MLKPYALAKGGPPKNSQNADGRCLTDKALWDGLDLTYPPLKRVQAALSRGDGKQAQIELVAHFRKRSAPVITKFRTDPHWSDWEGDLTLIKRADLLARFQVVEESKGVQGVLKQKQRAEIDWETALGFNHVIKRQGGMATLAEAWARTGRKKYAFALQTWMESHWQRLPFILDPAFHREDFSLFGGKAYPQLGSCYVLFHWADVLDSKLMRTPGVLPDAFWFEFIRRFWMLHYQFTRFLGASWRADNHHLMERGTACYFLGVGFPEFNRAKAMETYGRWNILKHFDHNLLADHTGSEACTSYQYRCFIRYAFPDSMARINGRTLLEKVREKKLKDWLEFQGYLVAPDGRLPESGDGSGPELARIAEESGAFYRSSVLKGILKRLKQDRAVNPAFQAAWDRTAARAPKTHSKLYPNGGHIALRDRWNSKANWLWMGIKNDALYDIHTHWNIFDFALSSFGSRVVANPNSRTYGLPQGLARGYYFSMDAHNTLVIDRDNLKSHEALAKAWGRQPTRISKAASCLNVRNTFDYARFRHDGYRPLLHRRDVFFVRGRYFIMTDVISIDFSGFNTVFAREGDIRPHHYRQRLHFEKGVRLRRIKGRPGLDARTAAGPGLLVLPEPFENLDVQHGPNRYLEELNDPRFRGFKMADITRETIGPCIFSTVYYPYSADAPDVSVSALTPRTTPFRDDRHHAIIIKAGGRRDIWVVQRNTAQTRMIEVEGSGIKVETDAAVLFLSTRGKKVLQAFRVGGNRVRLNGHAVRVPANRMTVHK